MSSITILVALNAEVRDNIAENFGTTITAADGRAVRRADLVSAIKRLNAFKAIPSNDASDSEGWHVTFEEHQPGTAWAMLNSWPDADRDDGRNSFKGDVDVMIRVVTALAEICGPQVLWPDTGDEPTVVTATGALPRQPIR